MRRTYVLVASLLAFGTVACTPAAPGNATVPIDEARTARAQAAPSQPAPDGTSWSVYLTVDLGNHVVAVVANVDAAQGAGCRVAHHVVHRLDGHRTQRLRPRGAQPAHTHLGLGGEARGDESLDLLLDGRAQGPEARQRYTCGRLPSAQPAQNLTQIVRR